MFRIVWGYRGGIYDRGFVEMLNEFVRVEYPDVGQEYNIGELYDTWFNASWFNPLDMCLAVGNGSVYGYSYVRVDTVPPRVIIRFDPRLSNSVVTNVVTGLLECSRHRLLSYGMTTPLVQLMASYEYRLLDRVYRSIFSHVIAKYTATLMKLDTKRYRVFRSKLGERRDLVFRHRGLESIKDIVEIYNDAFSIYPWFYPWSVEDAERFYKRYQNEIFAIIAYSSDEAIGYCDYRVYENISGSRIAYIYTLAVKKKYQRRGVGTALLVKAIDYLLSSGIRDIYLDAVEGLEKYYLERGFTIINNSVSYIIEF
ncbi:MAG: GNAT family N-acetyltransferase [Thermoprotei archaeon]